MRTAIFIILFLSIQFTVIGSQRVYTLHGFGNSRAMMHKLTKTFKNEGFDVVNVRYRSMVIDLDSLGEQLYSQVKSSGVDTVSFVTFSMGALVVRSMLQYLNNDPSFPYIYRIVMIAPPNKGSEVADFYSSYKIFNAILGPNVVLMRTDTNSYVNNLPVPEKAEIGIITCARGHKHGYNLLISGDNDGFISPKRTFIGTEKDRAIVNSDHTTVTRKKITRELALDFLLDGHFLPD